MVCLSYASFAAISDKMDVENIEFCLSNTNILIV